MKICDFLAIFGKGLSEDSETEKKHFLSTHKQNIKGIFIWILFLLHYDSKSGHRYYKGNLVS